MKDVVIIGGGPAGNNAAFHLSSAGLDVAVVDWREQLGDKVCSGIVGKACVERYPVDQSFIYREASSARFYSPCGEDIQMAKPGVQAYIIDRVAFVASLAEKAKAAGAAYYLGRRATEIEVTGTGVTITLSSPDGSDSIEAKTVIVAAGFRTGLLSTLGLGSVGDSCVGTQVEVATNGIEEIEVYFGKDMAPGFFGWVIPTAPGKGLVGLLSRHDAGNYLQALITRLQSQGKISEVQGPSRRWGVPLRPLRKTYSDRVLVVGDAAGQVKPTTGGGIYYALLSAEIAASTLNRAFSKADFSSGQLRSYQTEWRKVLSKELRIGYYSRRIFEMLGDTQIDYLLNTISTNGVHEELLNNPNVSFDWHGGFVLTAMKNGVIRKVVKSVAPLLPRRY